MAFYVLDENKNLVLSFDAEGFLAILQQAIADQSLANIDPDSAVASKLRSIINGTTHHIEFITAAQYSDLENRGLLVAGTYYFITDDTTEEDLEQYINGLAEDIEAVENAVSYKEKLQDWTPYTEPIDAGFYLLCVQFVTLDVDPLVISLTTQIFLDATGSVDEAYSGVIAYEHLTTSSATEAFWKVKAVPVMSGGVWSGSYALNVVDAETERKEPMTYTISFQRVGIQRDSNA